MYEDDGVRVQVRVKGNSILVYQVKDNCKEESD